MLHLNLASRKLKEEIRLRHIYNVIKHIGYLMVVAIIFVSIVFLSAQTITQNNFNRIVAETTLITKNGQSQNNRIREINASINYVDEIQNNFFKWSLLFYNLSKKLNNNIKFYSISINKEKKEVLLRGVAAFREDLITFKEGVEKSDLFLNIDFPIKNILEKENINFEIKAEINLEKVNDF